MGSPSMSSTQLSFPSAEHSVRLHINYSVVLPFFARIVKELQARHGVTDTSGFLYGRDTLPELAAAGLAPDTVRTLTGFLKTFDADGEPDLAYLRQKEAEYGDPNLYLMVAGCRFIGSFEHRKALRLLEAGFRLFEQQFDDFRPDAVLSDGVACTMSYIQYAIARKRGIPFLTLAAARVNDRFYIIRNRQDRYERVEELFEIYKRQGLPEPLRQHAQTFLDTFRGVKQKPKYYLEYAQPPKVDFASLRTVRELLHRRSLDPDNYLLQSPWRALAGRLTRLTKNYVLDPGYFEQPVPGEKFVFFPLHFQPEMTTLVLGPYAVNQVAVVENIAKTLPIDHRLYVKEHKACLGRRETGYYRRLREIPNVRLISPHADSHDLIKQSSAVCVISSTVGWEALLYEKPVVSIGDVFYNAYDGVQYVDSYAALPQAFWRAINEYRPDRKLLLKYIAANIEGTYDGDAYYTPGGTNPGLRAENISVVARAVAFELGLSSSPAAADHDLDTE